MKGASTTQSTFEQLTDCLDDSLIEEWTNQEQVAMEKCGDHLKIFTVTSDKRMTEGEVQQGNLSGAVSTFTEGLAIEKSQYVGNDLPHPANLVTFNI